MVFTLIVHLYTKDDPAAIASVAAKLVEASQVYSKDKGTISWFVMQDHVDKRAFTIVERYDQESSLQIHTQNPFYAEFGAFVRPLLDKPSDTKMVFTLIVHLYTKDDPAVIASVAAKLAEASQIYMKDKGTISWFVMQDHVDKRAFTIVERYDQESSLQIHNANPFFAEFGAHVWPLLDKPVDVRRCFELE